MTVQVFETVDAATVNERLEAVEVKIDFIYAFCVQANEFMAQTAPTIGAALEEIMPTINKVRPMIEAMFGGG